MWGGFPRLYTSCGQLSRLSEDALELEVDLVIDRAFAQGPLQELGQLVQGIGRQLRQPAAGAFDEGLAAAPLGRGQEAASRLTIAATAGSGTPTGHAAAAASRSASGRSTPGSRSTRTRGSIGSGRR